MVTATKCLKTAETNLGLNTVALPKIPRESLLHLRKEFGLENLDEANACAVFNAQAELADCRDCKGTCRKEFRRYKRPLIQSDVSLKISFTPCEFAARQKLQTKCRELRVPYAGKTFDDYQTTPDNDRAYAIAQWFCAEYPLESLYFYGGCGTGKTFLASIIAQHFLPILPNVIFGDVPSLLDEIKRAFNSDEDVLGRYCNCDLLILDDLGSGQITEWNVGQLYQIINNREGKRTIVTSNYDLAGLRERLSVKDLRGKIIDEHSATRIASRLGSYTKAFFGTKDRRLSK